MAGSADHEGLASPSCHDLHPFRPLWLPRLLEVGELSDLVHLHLVRPPTHLTPSRLEPLNQLSLARGFPPRSAAV